MIFSRNCNFQQILCEKMYRQFSEKRHFVGFSIFYKSSIDTLRDSIIYFALITELNTNIKVIKNQKQYLLNESLNVLLSRRSGRNHGTSCVRSTSSDLPSRGVGDGAERGQTELRHPGDRETAAPAITLAARQGRHWPDQEPGALPREPRPAQGTRGHTPSGQIAHEGLPGYAKGQFYNTFSTVFLKLQSILDGLCIQNFKVLIIGPFTKIQEIGRII